MLTPEQRILFDTICNPNYYSYGYVYNSLPLNIHKYSSETIRMGDVLFATEDILHDYYNLRQVRFFAYNFDCFQQELYMDFFNYKRFTHCFRHIERLFNYHVCNFLNNVLTKYQKFPQIEIIIKQQLICAQDLHYYKISSNSRFWKIY